MIIRFIYLIFRENQQKNPLKAKINKKTIVKQIEQNYLEIK